MTELNVDIGDIKIPDGFRKDCAVFRIAKRGERHLCGDGCLHEALHDQISRSIVLIPEPQPYVFPPWCKLWGAAMDENGKVWLYTHRPELEGAVWQIEEGTYLSPETANTVGMPLITRDHFTDWKTPIINQHWKGE